MATPAQIQANRLNAMKSTGPTSEAGKAASRFNALKHGMDAKSLTIPGEDPAELEALALDYNRDLRPVGPLENFFVETIVKADWDRRRYARIESQVIRQLVAPGPGGASLPAVGGPPTDTPLGDVFLADARTGNALQKLFRRQSSAERSYYRALAELRRAQRERLAEMSEEAEKAEEACGDASPTGPMAPIVAHQANTAPLESTPIGFVLQDFFRKSGPTMIPVSPTGLSRCL